MSDEEKAIKWRKTGQGHVEVEARDPGDFRVASISGQERSAQEQEHLLNDIADQIRRHVDELPSSAFNRSRGVSVVMEHKPFVGDQEYDTLFDALSDMLGEDLHLPSYTLSGKRQAGDEYISQASKQSFEDAVEFAYEHPFEFEIVNAIHLTDSQRVFLERVTEHSRERKAVKK